MNSEFKNIPNPMEDSEMIDIGATVKSNYKMNSVVVNVNSNNLADKKDPQSENNLDDDLLKTRR